MCAFSITGDEVETWVQEHHPGYFLAHPHIFDLSQVQPTTTATGTIPTTNNTPTLSQQIDCC